MVLENTVGKGENAFFSFSQCFLLLSKSEINLLAMFNPFPHNKILDQTKLKAFADDKLIMTKMIISVFDRVENIVGKGEIACTSNFFFSLNVFKRLLFQRRQKVSLCGNGLICRLQIPVCFQVGYVQISFVW